MMSLQLGRGHFKTVFGQKENVQSFRFAHSCRRDKKSCKHGSTNILHHSQEPKGVYCLPRRKSAYSCSCRQYTPFILTSLLTLGASFYL